MSKASCSDCSVELVSLCGKTKKEVMTTCLIRLNDNTFERKILNCLLELQEKAVLKNTQLQLSIVKDIRNLSAEYFYALKENKAAQHVDT